MISNRALVEASAAKAKRLASTVFGKIVPRPNPPKRSAMGSTITAMDSSTTTHHAKSGKDATKANAPRRAKKTKIVATTANVSKVFAWAIHARASIVPKARRVCQVAVSMLARRSLALKDSFVGMESAAITRVMGWVVRVGRCV